MPKQVEVELGTGLKIRVEEGCDLAYVAALVGRLRQHLALLTLPRSVRIYLGLLDESREA